MKTAKTLLVVGGATGSGKTSLAIQLAKKANAEIISFDSRQFYKELNIGVARPSESELAEVKHHFIASHSIHEPLNAGTFAKEATILIEKLFEEQDTIVLVGGSGLYLDAIIHPFDPLPSNDEVRNALNEQHNENGLTGLLQELEMTDPEFYLKVDKDNSQRIIRALEVIRISNQPYSLQRIRKPIELPFEVNIFITNLEREKLYNLINQRVDLMMELGWLEEVKTLFEHKNLAALNTVGYKELFDFMEEKIEWNECLETIKMNTRRYAKRQVTWFKKYENAILVNTLSEKSIKEALNSF